jgi:hypothetical protein
MSESRIKGPGQDGSITPPADPKAVYELEPELPTLDRELRLRADHDAWLLVVAVVYPAMSFPLLFLSHDAGILLASTALAVLVVAAGLYLWVVEVLSNGWAVAAFAAWMGGAVFLQWMFLTSIWANV